MENNQSSGKEEGEENKVLLVSSKDEFCLQQDVCAMCGAFGQDQEGRLIACAQCGQCYHPFCANVKVSQDNVLYTFYIDINVCISIIITLYPCFV